MLTAEEKKEALIRLRKAIGQMESLVSKIENDEPTADMSHLLKTAMGSLKGAAQSIITGHFRSLVDLLVRAKSSDVKKLGVEDVTRELVKSAEVFTGARTSGQK
ncbi:metal-sensing transcriptional repressor [Lacipirellula parvula]|uniref:Uncharacterized protein n=1 Tax=Lacipirellula parvula TaxID=2650471 RepID=A0A5K7XHL9_9BACT|nr:metal-sensing transcriptional repressor [Lacipirellula parvula]BBO34451.1 hypothetical protein PLANPX_4063 [Lacipirellula parvula]